MRRVAERRARARGVVAVLVAVLLVVLIGFVMLVVDIGQLYRARSELQNASDAAAHAGAEGLDGTAAGLASARALAHEYAARHDAIMTAVSILDDDIVLGSWDSETEVFTPLPADPGPGINAVKVTARRDESSNGRVALFFAPVLGLDFASVTASAIAVGGGPLSECGFPMVVADCTLQVPIEEGTCAFCMTYQDNNNDNAGWTAFDESSVGGPNIAAAVRAACFAADGSVAIDPETGQCAGACVGSYSGQEIKVTNGNMMNTGANNFCRVIQLILTRDVVGGVPQPFTVRVPVLKSTGAGCDASQFSSYHQIAGYAAMEIFGAKCGNADPGVIATVPGSCRLPTSDKYVVARLRCDVQSQTGPAGGGWFGLEAVHVRLVR